MECVKGARGPAIVRQIDTQEHGPAIKKQSSSLPGHSGFPGFGRAWHVLLQQGWLQRVKRSAAQEIQKLLFPPVFHVGDHSFTCSFVCLSGCLSVHPPTCPFIYTSIFPSIHPLTFHLPVLLLTHLPILVSWTHPSIYLHIYLLSFSSSVHYCIS